MPRVKILPDADVLEIAHRLIHRHGPDALTFAMLSEASGLSAATLVQRFGSKAELIRAALLQAWDQLDARTAQLAASTAKTPEGAVAMLRRYFWPVVGLVAVVFSLWLVYREVRGISFHGRLLYQSRGPCLL